MASSFAASVQPGSPQPRVALLTVDPAATFARRALVYLDTADNLIKLCGADPALIMGFAQCSAADAIAGSHGQPAGLVPVELIEASQVWIMGSSTTPADSHLTDAYGIVSTSSVWLVDTSDTVNTRLTVVDYSPKTGQVGKECFYVRFLPANLQSDGILS